MLRMILWLLIAVLTAWLVGRRLRKGSPMAAIGLVLGMIAAVYLGLALLLLVFQSKLVYMPWAKVEMTPADIGLDFEDLRIATPDGQALHAWYIPAEDAAFTVLFCHGNAGNISHRLDTLQILHDLDLNCLIFDYRGYGQSTGRPSEEGTIIDALAGRQWLIDHKQISPDRIVLFGRSLGGAVAAVAAARIPDTPPAGLIIESSFTSVPDLGARLHPWLPVRFFARFSYDAKTALQSVDCPVFIIRSPDDEMIPFEMGETLYAAAHDPKRLAEIQGSHNEGFIEHVALYRSVWKDAIRFFTHAE